MLLDECEEFDVVDKMRIREVAANFESGICVQRGKCY